MNSSKNPLSGFRYFKAGLKPFRKFTFWGPPSAIAIIALCYWQYRSNPAWLNTSFEQPEGVESVLNEDPNNPDNQEIGLEMPLQSIARDAQNQQAEQFPLVDPLSPQGTITSPTTEQQQSTTATPEGTFGLGQSRQNKKDESKEESKTPQIFIPLMPNIKNPSSIFSNNSNSQNQNNSTNPPALSPINGLMKPKPVNVTDNPLQNAMEQSSSGEATANTEPNTTINQSESQSRVPGSNSNNSPTQSGQSSNNFSNQSAATQPLTQNYQSQPPYYNNAPGMANPAQTNSPSMQAYQNPYLNSPVQTNPAQPSSQTYQPSYNNVPIPASPYQAPVQPYQAPVQPYQNPYLNNPVPQTPPITQNQYGGSNYVNSPAGNTQVQRAIEEFGSD